MTRIAIAALALMLMLPTAQAAVGLSVTPLEAPIPYDGSADLAYEATVDCQDVLGTGGAEATLNLNVSGAAWLSASGDTEQTVSLAECIGQTTVTKSGALSLTPSSEAPGRMVSPITVTAMLGDASGSADTEVEVSFRPGFSVTPQADFPMQATTDGASFDLLVSVTANAQAMVMFELVETGVGSLSGLKPTTLNPGDEATLQVAYTPPEGEWNETTFAVQTFHHCLAGANCDPTGHKEMSWTFMNGGDAMVENDDGHGEEEEDTPGPGLLLLVAAIGLAMLLRRRK